MITFIKNNTSILARAPSTHASPTLANTGAYTVCGLNRDENLLRGRGREGREIMGRDDVHNRWRRVEEHTAVLCALWTWGSGEAFIRVPLTFGEIGSFGRVTTSRSGPR